MKTSGLIVVILFLGLIMSCSKKKSDTVYPLSLSGKWNLAVDSTATGAAVIDFSEYKGVTGDYFDFRTDGKCYVKEGSHYDTLAYNITTDTTLNIQTFGFSNKAIYTKPKNPYTTVTIISAGPSAPGGYDYREVRLIR